MLKTATYATLATLYGIGTGISVIQLARICRSTKERFTSQTILHMFVFLTLCSRTVTNAVLQFVIDTRVYYFLDTFPAALSYTAFLFVIAFWADLYYRSRGRTPHSTTIFVIFTALFYVAAIIVYTLFLTLNSYDQMALLYKAIIGVGITMTAVLVLGGGIFGYLTFNTLRDFPVVLPAVKRMSRKAGIVAVICVACFLLRALVLAITAGLQTSSNPHIVDVLASATYFCAFQISYSLVAEIFPMSLLMYFMGSVPERNAESTAIFIPPEQPAQLERSQSHVRQLYNSAATLSPSSGRAASSVATESVTEVDSPYRAIS